MPTNTIMPRPDSPDAHLIDRTHKANLARQLKANQIIREHARELINPTAIIGDLLQIEIDMRPLDNGEVPEQMTLNALKARADIKFKLLDKALPNLKATELIAHHQHDHSGEIGVKVTDIELAQRLQLWRQNKIIDVTPTIIEEEEEYDFI